MDVYRRSYLFHDALDGEEEKVPELARYWAIRLEYRLLSQIHRLDLDKGGNAHVHFQGSAILTCHG